MTHTFQGYDRPDIGNKAWVSIGMVVEALPSTRRFLEPVSEYIRWLEAEVLAARETDPRTTEDGERHG